MLLRYKKGLKAKLRTPMLKDMQLSSMGYNALNKDGLSALI